ncbi:MAG TPA: glycoside hydrolase family 3 C-terminal domain-containing protein, partial [Actinopolymorphaceae bacterium]
ALAAAADVAVVVVGTSAEIESEGVDRESLALPGRQNELVDRVLEVNPRTVVVVNAGAPVELPWADRAPAVLLSWFPGQEFGNALADVLLGHTEPGGRLPTSWPVVAEDCPVLSTRPRSGVLAYDESIHLGYRGWARTGRTPRYPFGHGLGYTTWEYGEARAEVGQENCVVRIPVTNTGRRRGKTVAQVYASRTDSAIDRPRTWLVGFTVVEADPGETVAAEIGLSSRAFAHWDVTARSWQLEPGEFALAIGASSSDIRAITTVVVDSGQP